VTKPAGEFFIKTSTVALEKYLTEAANSTSSDLLLNVSGADFFLIRDIDGSEHVVERNIRCIAVVTGSFGQLDITKATRIPEVLKSTSYLDENDPDQLFVQRNGSIKDFSKLQKFGLIDLPT
jgi:hypothetical protein